LRVSVGVGTARGHRLGREVDRARAVASFTSYRIRALFYAGRPNWALLDILTPT